MVGVKDWAGFELGSSLGGGRTFVVENLRALHILGCLCSSWHHIEEQVLIQWV